MKYITGRFLRCLPQHQVSSLSGKITKAKLSKLAIKPYAKYYKIDLSSIEKPMRDYKNLNQFFTRKLKPESRPIDLNQDTIISPSDGLITQIGSIEDGSLIQAKGVCYSLKGLLAGHEQANLFQNGSYMTIYLSPRDYHRVHAPINGNVTEFSYIPGRLFPVNRLGVHSINGLYAKNERLITYMNTAAGKLAIVKVGAFIVGSVQVAYKEQVQRFHKGRQISQKLRSFPYFKKGDEIGHFEFGSTVIVLFENDLLELDPSINPGQFIKMGERIGSCSEATKEQSIKVAVPTM
ncbi:archaetidylserine decarboxylase [Alkalihalobacillus sp. AL-G]|uniref:archaetidylserine decarboxylase n=1 Tax=Alkalihalobacillus sp. AL-G TaxID=2926399 RepID=UPI00272BEF02|nr:archaetidylserine decarboxylase [Alkalihalobacillus sp. AL-G]WLD94035.1 archaetidylserine decarboxylase [Alkalihalobacillus sp. AL-G]